MAIMATVTRTVHKINTVLNLILHMEKNNFNFENARFSDKGHQSLHIIKKLYRICKMLISYVRLDHTLNSINYSICIA